MTEPTTEWKETPVTGRFRDQTIIVTGAASGIGRATTERIIREGGRVIAADLNQEHLDALQSALGENLIAIAGDITKQDDVDRIVTAAGQHVDGLANIAGIIDDFGAAHEMSDAMWRRVFAVNVDGTFRLTRAVAPLMLAAGRGSIVNVASEASLRGNAAGVAYTASKHAVVGLTKNCAFMYGPQGIRVNAVAPGGVDTNISDSATGPRADFGMQRVGPFFSLMPPTAQASHLAASITFLLSDDGININGAILPSDGGWSVQ